MYVERQAPGAELIEVLDRVLDKGIVFDASMKIGLVGLHLMDIELRVVIASIETYRKYAGTLELANIAARKRQLSTHN